VPVDHRLLVTSSAKRAVQLRASDGIGLIELLIAMTILAVAISALVAVFASSIISLGHSGREGTALTLADRQLEAYRSMPFSATNRCVPKTLPSTAPTLSDGTSCAAPFSGFPNPYAASQVVSGANSPDHRSYTVTTTVSGGTCSSATNASCRITVSVRLTSGGPELARETSDFSQNGTTVT
jgi:Tfp pilus assembly protein PilV